MEQKPLIQKLLEVPKYKEQYHEYLQEILTGYFANGKFDAAVDTLFSRISPHLQCDPTSFYTFAQFQKGAAALKLLGGLREQSIQGQLNASIPSTTAMQTAQPDLLIDATELTMADLGGPQRPERPGGPQGRP